MSGADFLRAALPHLPLPRAPLLDLACGRGRNALAAAAAGHFVIGADKNRAALAELRALAKLQGHAGRTAALCCNLESGRGIPLRDGSCGAVLVFRYLHRPLAAEIIRVLMPGGWLLYETFTLQQREFPQGPNNPEYLLAPGELAKMFPALETQFYEEGIFSGADFPQALARLRAQKLFGQ